MQTRSFRVVDQTAPSATIDRAADQCLELQVLGSFDAVIGGNLLDLGGPKQRAVLALLALRAPHPLSIDAVIDGLCGETAPEAARSSVYAYVSNLRSILGGGIERHRGSYVLSLPFTSDADAF